MPLTSTIWLDRLLDWAHDAGAHVCWGTRNTRQYGQQPSRAAWVNLQLPDRVVEHIAPTYDSAAFRIMNEIAPDPDDQPDPT